MIIVTVFFYQSFNQSFDRSFNWTYRCFIAASIITKSSPLSSIFLSWNISLVPSSSPFSSQLSLFCYNNREKWRKLPSWLWLSSPPSSWSSSSQSLSSQLSSSQSSWSSSRSQLRTISCDDNLPTWQRPANLSQLFNYCSSLSSSSSSSLSSSSSSI